MLDCSANTDSQMQSLMPMLMMGDEGTSDNLMMFLMMQSMGDSPVGMDQMLPLLMMNDMDEDSGLLMMVLMNSMTGGLNHQSGFDTNFNMMLPLVMNTCGDGDDACEKKQKNMMVLMMAMQSQAPGTAMGADMMLPLMLMDDSSDNESLIFFMMMSQNQGDCQPIQYQPIQHQPIHQPIQPIQETVFRTFRVNADGTKTLINESNESFETQK